MSDTAPGRLTDYDRDVIAEIYKLAPLALASQADLLKHTGKNDLAMAAFDVLIPLATLAVRVAAAAERLDDAAAARDR